MKRLIQKIKDTLSIFSSSKGFTLLELLVVVLIIGILTAIALPQYQMAVTKAKVASILPLMRRWKDALQEYKLQHGDYCIKRRAEDDSCEDRPDGATLGVNWPSDWQDDAESCGDSPECSNDYWYCSAGEEGFGEIRCTHEIINNNFVDIYMFQNDDPNCEVCRGKIICSGFGTGNKICKSISSTKLENSTFEEAYSLSK